ncbi:MAG: hypothetical protein ACKUBY_05995 [Candidatus Moraniibacteriota bacterium]|jgi:hypothetical protein
MEEIEQNFNWIFQIQPATELFPIALTRFHDLNLVWTPTSDAAMRVILSGINGALASRKESLNYLTAIETLILEERVSINELVIIAMDMQQSTYSQFVLNDPTMPFTEFHYNLLKKAELFVNATAITDVACNFKYWYIATETSKNINSLYNTAILLIFYAANGGTTDRISMRNIIVNLTHKGLFSSHKAMIILAQTIMENPCFIMPSDETFPPYLNRREFDYLRETNPL